MRLHSYLAILGATGVGLAFVVSTTGGCTITNAADDGGSPNASVDTDSGVSNTDSGVSDTDSGGDAAPTSIVGFAASNLGGLGTIDTTKLTDVSIAAATTIDSDVDDSATLGSTPGSVVYQVVTQSDGSSLGVYVARSWTIPAGAIVHTKGAYPIVLVATTTIDISGALDASSAKNVAGAGALTPTTVGVGTGAGGSGSATLGVAAAGGTFCGAGGTGGFYTAQSAATVAAAYGTPTLTPLLAGASGGVGANAAGAGGGAIQLVAGTSISIQEGGSVAANGGGGGNSGSVAVSAIQIGSGGGSGGAVLLESPVVTVNGTVAANGGGGGGNSGNFGQDGQTTATPAMGTGTGSGLGGNGSGGTAIVGVAGANGSGSAGTGNDIPPGGGGGGAGWIRINTTSSAATIGANAISSPANGTTCFTQGAITAN
jgi:hypothetical protein